MLLLEKIGTVRLPETGERTVSEQSNVSEQSYSDDKIVLMTGLLHETITETDFPELAKPRVVRSVKLLGKGRAAKAVLVDATFGTEQTIRCVEKRFTPGFLTRLIYRIGFQSPFAYQTNCDAILACFYRRLVVNLILQGTKAPVSVARPLYVRFDQPTRSWVLAAEWIQGRGIRPAVADPNRPLNRIKSIFRVVGHDHKQSQSEVDELVEIMGQLESQLNDCGLNGTGWQVSPHAIVSTANLLRVRTRYTVIDLESGIPAVLVKRYLIDGIRRFQLPPFDELDPNRLTAWYRRQYETLLQTIGSDQTKELEFYIEKLIFHHQAWKQGEIALLRKPYQWLTKTKRRQYRAECLRRWHQDNIIRNDDVPIISESKWRYTLIWMAGLIPGKAGRLIARIAGNQKYRQQLIRLFLNRRRRTRFFNRVLALGLRDLKRNGLVTKHSSISWRDFYLHWLCKTILTTNQYRFCVNRAYRIFRLNQIWQLIWNPRYQNQYAHRSIRSMIRRWERTQRIQTTEAQLLRSSISAVEIRHYLRGFSYHLSLKFLSPILVPLKITGLVKFAETGNLIYLTPFLGTSAARLITTLVNQWLSRKEAPSHRVALTLSWLPVVGVFSFPAQLYASNVRLSQFLIRDIASQLGQKAPIYGGADSRLEIWLIQLTDWIFALMQLILGSGNLATDQETDNRSATHLSLADSSITAMERSSAQSIHDSAESSLMSCDQSTSDKQTHDSLVA